jgi:PAS domain S-box-containing protein/putative nucleotidyltransferase with HDIG domain
MNDKAPVFLAVDDKIENLISLKALLKEAFPHSLILTAQSGKDGLALAHQHDPDIILLDVMMPDMNGYEVCRILKADPILQDIPVIFVTALSGDRETRLKAVENGAEAFIHKPIDELELQIQLRTLLRLRQLNVQKKERIDHLEEGLTNKTKALNASEERFKIMVNSISDTIGITDINGIITYRSPNNARLFGVDPAEIIGKSSFDFVHPDDRERIRQEYLSLIEGGPGTSRIGDFRYLRYDGSTVCVEVEGRNMLDDPIINGLLLTYRDITQRKEVDRKLEEESEKLRALIESTEDLVWLVDPEEFGLIMYNSALYRYFESGRGLHITPGMTPDDLLPETFAEQWRSMYRRVLHQGAYTTEYMTSSLGKTLSLSFYPVKIEDSTIGISVLGQDITQKKKLELQLIEKSQQNQRILDNLQDAYFQADLNGLFTLVNPKAVTMYNYASADELIGQKAESLYGSPEERQQMAEKLKQNGYLTDYVGRGRRKDNSTFWVSMNVQYVRDAGGKIIGTEGLVRDIDERIAMEEAIKNQRDHLIESNEKLLKSELKFKTMLETIPAALFLTVDNHTKIEYLSSYFTEMLGYSYEDLPSLDQWFAKAYPNETYRQQVINETTDALVKSLADPAYKTELVSDVTCKDGSIKHMMWRGLMLDNQWLGCGFDLTRIHEANLKLQQRLHQSVIAISKIGEMRDVYTAGHQKRVQQLSIAIARRMNLSEEVIQNIAYGALIHDIGKIYIASDILNKPGKISNLEYQILQTHAEHGYEIAKEIDFPEIIPLMIRQHHERLDGSGYPLGLKGEEIRMESRILAVADVVEAMTSHRPYRAALGIEVAFTEIDQYKGVKYDQHVVDVCLDLFKSQSFMFIE